MGTRALRKLREQEWERRMAAQNEEQKSESSEEEPVIVSKPKNAFDMLNDADEAEDEAEEVQTDHVKPEQEPVRSSTPSSTGKKKKKKKPKRKTKESTTPQAAESAQASEDEIDKALKELALKNPITTDDEVVRSSEDVWEERASKHLQIDPRNLDLVNEMRGLFGNIAVEDERQSQRPPDITNPQEGVDLETALRGRYNRATQGRELGPLAKRRNCLMQGKEYWPLSTSGGLSMELSKKDGWKRSYNIIHNQQYQEGQQEFGRAVSTWEPEAIIGVLQRYPYHVTTLLQVASIAKLQGDTSVSGDLLQRALYTFGRSVHSSFPAAMREGTARLDFNKPENRELYLTIFQWIQVLCQRGTWRTAYTWCKVLLSFDPISDPYGMTLWIDQFALRARRHEEFLDMLEENVFGNTWSSLPNICISKTLALYRVGKTKEARQQLALAIHRYPYIISDLASSLEINPMPKSLWGKLPSNDAEKFNMILYAERAKDLWNTPETIGLISEVANTAKYYTIDQSPAPPLQISLEEARHAWALALPSAMALIPRQFQDLSVSENDILPPPTSENRDFARRAPGRDGGYAILERIRNTVIRGLMGFNPFGDGPTREEQLQQIRQEMSWRGENVTEQEVLREYERQNFAPFGDPDSEENRRIGEAIRGGYNYFPEQDLDVTSEEDMPDLEDVPRTPEGGHVPDVSVAYFNPRAATVEEAEDEDQPAQSGGAGRALLHRVDEDDSPALDLSRPSTHATTVPPVPATASAIQPSVPDNESLEGDPQRLQRWLITTGLEELKTTDNMSTYVRRLKMLHQNQRAWILGIIKQQGSANLAVKVQNAL